MYNVIVCVQYALRVSVCVHTHVTSRHNIMWIISNQISVH